MVHEHDHECGCGHHHHDEDTAKFFKRIFFLFTP